MGVKSQTILLERVRLCFKMKKGNYIFLSETMPIGETTNTVINSPISTALS